MFIGAESAADRPARRCFNGKIEAPAIAGLGAWDFARRMGTMEIEDTGPNGLHGRLINLPTRAMKGAAWSDGERDWKRAPHMYAAIHFHDDDLHDCGWADDPIRALDVALLQERVLGPVLGIADQRTDQRIDFVGGIRGASALAARVDSGEAALGISLHPPTVEQLMAVSDAGHVMPPKSTWFEPKLLSGLFVHSFEPGRAP